MKASAKELMRSESGRRFLDKKRREAGTALLQPDNPKFEKVYGRENRKNAGIRALQEQQSRDGRVYLAEKREYANRKAGETLSRGVERRRRKEPELRL